MHAGDAQAAEAEAEQVRAPGDHHADGDGDQAGRDALRIAHAAEPAHHDDGKAGKPDDRRHEHFQRRAHRDEGDRHAGERAEQGGARRDLAHDGRDEAADHQDEALEEHPDQAGFPALDRVAGLERDRQHDHEGDDEHMRHADARGQGADVAAAGFLRQAIGEPGVVEGGQAHHQAQSPAGCGRTRCVRHLEHEAQQAGEHQHVDQDVGAEAEEGVPVARRPQCRFEACRCAHHLLPCTSFGPLAAAKAASIFFESETQPKMPPCALIIFRPISWNSGK